MYNLAVSVPYRGLGSFLQPQEAQQMVDMNGFRPLARLGGVPTKTIKLGLTDRHAFPSPLEVWVGSYKTSKSERSGCFSIISGPSRGLGSFLQKMKKYVNKNGNVFPAPLEVWVGSYFIQRTRRKYSMSFRPLSRLG